MRNEDRLAALATLDDAPPLRSVDELGAVSGIAEQRYLAESIKIAKSAMRVGWDPAIIAKSTGLSEGRVSDRIHAAKYEAIVLAVCDQNWTVEDIKSATKIPEDSWNGDSVEGMLRTLGGMTAVKQLKRQHELEEGLEVARAHYTPGMGQQKLAKLAGIKESTAREAKRRLDEERQIEEAPRTLMSGLAGLIARVAGKVAEHAEHAEIALGDEAVRHAREYCDERERTATSRSRPPSRKQTTSRMRGILAARSEARLAEEWDMTRAGAASTINRFGKRELYNERRKRSKPREETPFAYATEISRTSPLDFETIYERTKLIFEGLEIEELAELLEMELVNVPQFIRKTGMREVYERTRTQRRKQEIEYAKGNDPLFYTLRIRYGQVHEQVPFDETWGRVEDILDGLTIEECGEKWECGKSAVRAYIKSANMETKHSEKIGERIERVGANTALGRAIYHVSRKGAKLSFADTVSRFEDMEGKAPLPVLTTKWGVQRQSALKYVKAAGYEPVFK